MGYGKVYDKLGALTRRSMVAPEQSQWWHAANVWDPRYSLYFANPDDLSVYRGVRGYWSIIPNSYTDFLSADYPPDENGEAFLLILESYGTYTFYAILEDQFTVVKSGNGTVVTSIPSGSDVIDNQTLVITSVTPDAGYETSSIQFNGVDVAVGATLTCLYGSTNTLEIVFASSEVERPTGLAGVPSDGAIDLTWDAQTADSFNLYWSNTPGVTTGANKISDVESPFSHEELTNGTPYYYAITAVVSGVESELSEEVLGTPQAPVIDTSNDGVYIDLDMGSGTIFRVSNFTREYNGYAYEGRLANAPSLENKTKEPDESTSVIQQTFSVRNHTDQAGVSFINLSTYLLWGCKATITLVKDAIAETWSGKIKAWSENDKKELILSVAEDPSKIFTKTLPDEVIRLVTYTGASGNAVMAAIPTIFGGTQADPITVKGLLADTATFRYIVGAGPIRSVEMVLKDRTEYTDDYIVYLGTSDQAIWPGIAYIRLDGDPRDDAGRWPEILVKVVGMKFPLGEGSMTEDQCRNPATILQKLLTQAESGVQGWGIGVSESDIDSTSFAQAVTDCDTYEFKADGAIFEQKPASFWIAQILQACRGELYQESGLWKLRIDQIRASTKSYTTENMKMLYFGRGSSTELKNRIVLDYRYDAADGALLGNCTREDMDTITNIDRQESKIRNLMIRDSDTANNIADYLLRTEIYGSFRIEFETIDFTGLERSAVIDITFAEYGLSATKFVVQAIKRNDFSATITARSYDDAIFGNDTPATHPGDPSLDPISGALPSSPPASPTDMALTTGVTIQPDGTALAFVDGTYAPGARTLFVEVGIAEGDLGEDEPGDLTFKTVVTDSSGYFHVEPLKINTHYVFKLTAKNDNPQSASPVYADILTGEDTMAPAKPVAPLLTSIFKSVLVKCGQNLTEPAPDLAGYKIYRFWVKATSPSPNDHYDGESYTFAEVIGFAACSGNHSETASFLDESTEFDKTYYYWSAAVDRSGNESALSDSAGPVGAMKIISGELAACAVQGLNIAAGAICSLHTALAAIDPNSGCLCANTVATCNLLAGAVTADKIIAGAITTEKLLVGNFGWNRITNGGGEEGTVEGWYSDSCSSLSVSCTEFNTGSKSILVVGSTEPSCDPHSTYKAIPVSPGDKMYLQFSLKSTCTFTGKLDVKVYEKCSAPATDHPYVDDGNKDFATSILQAGDSGAAWCSRSFEYTVPSCVHFISPYFSLDGVAAGSEFFLDDVALGPQVGFTQIANGTVTSTKMAADTILACNICSTTVLADCIKSGTIRGVYLKSLDWCDCCPTSGSLFELECGKFYLGGCVCPKLSWDGTDLIIRGGLSAETGSIGGWCIDTTCLYKDNAILSSCGYLELGSGCDIARMDAQNADYRFWVGHTNPVCAPTSISKSGFLKAICGQIGHFNIFENGVLQLTSTADCCHQNITWGTYLCSYGARPMAQMIWTDCNCSPIQSRFVSIHLYRDGVCAEEATFQLKVDDPSKYAICTNGIICAAGLETNGFGALDLSGDIGPIIDAHIEVTCCRCLTPIAIIGRVENGFGCTCTDPGIGVRGIGDLAGVEGYSYGGSAVRGFSTEGYGVYGCSYCCAAVAGNTAYCQVSSRQIKMGFTDVSVLEPLREIKIQKWLYHDRNHRGFQEFIGPVAEEFQRVFRLGFDNNGLFSYEGVALRGVQQLDECITALKTRLEKLEGRSA